MGVARRLYEVAREYGLAFVPVVGARHYVNRTKENLELLVGRPLDGPANRILTRTKVLAVALTAAQLSGLGGLVLNHVIGFTALDPMSAFNYVGASAGIACGEFIVKNYDLPDIKQKAGQPIK